MSNLNPFVGAGLLDELFRDVNPGYFIKPLHGDALPHQMRVDVRENAEAFVVEAEIPGAGKDQIHVDVDGNQITIRAQVSQQDRQSEGEKVLRAERYFGELTRRFQLSTEIDEQASKARYDNGILHLLLAKKRKKSGQRLSVE